MRNSPVGTNRISSKLIGRSIALAVALAVASPAPAFAQAKSHKRWYFGIGGALVVGIPAYAFTSDDAFDSTCNSKQCVGIVAALMGGLIGFLVGLEMDKKYERRMAAGPTLNYSFLDVPLDVVPDRITRFPGGVAIVGMGGARLIRDDGTVQPRGSGVRGIEDVAVMPHLDLLILSTFSNLISFEISSDSVYGQVIDERGGGSMGRFANRLAVAGLDSLRLLDVEKDVHEVAVETVTGIENPDYVTDMTFSGDGSVGWVLWEDRLVAYGPELAKIGEVTLPAAGRTVRMDGNRLAIAAGTSGVFVMDVTDPAAPRVVQHYEGVRFAYAADLEGDRVYVAAGPEGVALVDISGEEPRVVGVARETRFATDVVVSGVGEVWILDRDGQSVQIADFGIVGGEGRDTNR